jgi:hypothetical protein
MGFVTHVIMKPKFVEGVNSEKASLNLKRTRKVLLVRFQEEGNVEIAESGRNQYLPKQEKNMKSYILFPQSENLFIVQFAKPR